MTRLVQYSLIGLLIWAGLSACQKAPEQRPVAETPAPVSATDVQAKADTALTAAPDTSRPMTASPTEKGTVSQPKATVAQSSKPDTTARVAGPRMTFVELGSVNCIPCKQMQPVMKSIEEKYGAQIKVVFHDVWKDPEPGKKYNIDLIPTQVFLDAAGKEIMRHVGFFPEAEIDAFLQKQGLTILNPPTKSAS